MSFARLTSRLAVGACLLSAFAAQAAHADEPAETGGSLGRFADLRR